MAQRIVRAKRTLAEARVPFEAPAGPERAARLSSVLDVVYLVFTEGYSATAGDDWMRPELCSEAIRLGRLLTKLAPHEPEAHGLLALMQLQASRTPARTGPTGEIVLLRDQDRRRWDQLLVRRGLTALDRALDLDGSAGPYALQASIAACHARAPAVDGTDRTQIAGLYDLLADATPSPVVSLNRAVAHGMAFGLLPSVRGDLLAQLGRGEEARREFERAASLAGNARERTLLLDRAACATGGGAAQPQ